MNSSRRSFLASGLALPAAGLAVQAAPAAPKLSYRTLGRTGLKVTTVGYGCMITSDASVIEKAADLGVNYFDTARVYSGGNNERMVAGALKGKSRQKLVLSTKSHTRTKDQLLGDLDKSLSELSTDYVDIFFVHGVDSGAEITPEVLDALAAAKKSGKARFVGASTHRGQVSVLETAVQHRLDVILLTYNFSVDPSLEDAIAKAGQAGVGLIAMKVMAGGARRARAATLDILKREGAMLAALKWVIKNPHISTTIPSMTDMEQLEENLKAMGEPFSDADQKTLSAHLDRIRPVQCRMCGHCDGACPKGLPVADEMRFLMYAEGYGQFPLARERYLELPEQVRAVRCSDCTSCSVQCKYGLNVPERLSLAQQMLA